MAVASRDAGFGPVRRASRFHTHLQEARGCPGTPGFGRVGATSTSATSTSAESEALDCEEEGREPANLGNGLGPGRVSAALEELVEEVRATGVHSLCGNRLILALLLLLPQDS